MSLKVYCTSDDPVRRRAIKHPFGTSFDHTGFAEWPDDQFTQRRLRDGDVSLDPSKAKAEGKPQQLEVKPPEPKAKS